MNSLHTGVVRYMCPIRSCSKMFTQKWNQKLHTNAIHKKGKTFRCTKCPTEFFFKKLLLEHMASKHGEGKTFCCILCKKTFTKQSYLRCHMNHLHNDPLRFKCPFQMCSKSYNAKQNLEVHVNAVHTKKNVFECTTCGKKFYRNHSLWAHLANKH